MSATHVSHPGRLHHIYTLFSYMIAICLMHVSHMFPLCSSLTSYVFRDHTIYMLRQSN
ncbi:hypothetical protein GALMADRAFT_1320297 [Galerina marginata CBS 339.88]|uniref:Uncharacterized protein n=1 Tax=Galerina marginata (strain CBS 339.88) TaxID=685588 RepID=A0A067SEX4_GALM3|nr:hypothetical protein GALMADRAFT_1320297 [Galerina marginata CBS 339.88]